MNIKYAWVDIETSGLDEGEDDLLEVACIVTAFNKGNPVELGTFQCLVDGGMAWTSVEEFRDWRSKRWSPFIKNMHEANGLVADIEKVLREGQLLPSVEDVARRFEEFLVSHNDGDPKSLYLAGSSVAFDQRWLRLYMPGVLAQMHYRAVDVSSTRVQLHALTGEDPVFPKEKGHRAMADIRETIEEFKWLWAKARK